MKQETIEIVDFPEVLKKAHNLIKNENIHEREM